jgi:hypothetical protein
MRFERRFDRPEGSGKVVAANSIRLVDRVVGRLLVRFALDLPNPDWTEL